MKILFSTLLIALTALNAKAQFNVDSLLLVWKDKSQADTSRLNAMDELTWTHYKTTDLDSAQYYGQQMLDLARKKGLAKYEGIALQLFGVIQYRKGNPDEAREYFNETLEIRKKLGDKREIGRSLSMISNCYARQAEFIIALDYYERALALFEEIGDKELAINMLSTIGRTYGQLGNYDKAIPYFVKVLRAVEGEGASIVHVTTLWKMGELYLSVGELDLAQEYTEQARLMAKQIKNTELESWTVAQLAGIQTARLNHDKAISLFEKSLVLAGESVHWGFKSHVALQIGSNYEQKNEFDKAYPYYIESLEMSNTANSKLGKISSTLALGKLSNHKKEGNKAVQWCLQTLSLSEEVGDLGNHVAACECLYVGYKLVGRDKKALEYLEQYIKLNDSLQQNETSKRLQKVEFNKKLFHDSLATVEAARVVDEAHQLEVREKNRTRDMLAGGGLIVLLIAAALFGRVRYIRKSKAVLSLEKDRSENLLLNILPEEVADELKEKGHSDARHIDQVTVLFTDFKGFTAMSEELSPKALVADLHSCFSEFDAICEKYGIEKIKTIGDAYMAAGGLPSPNTTHAKDIVQASFEMAEVVAKSSAEKTAVKLAFFEIRIGIHTGPVVAGIVGVKKFQYDIWGDTVNTASRMESSGEVGKVNISQATYEILKDDPEFKFESRGKIAAKGKGEIEMWFVSMN